MARNITTIEEAEAALERARAFEAERLEAERLAAEAAAQTQHDREHEELVAGLERRADKVIADASMPSRIDRGSSEAARRFLYNLAGAGGQPGEARLAVAVKDDAPAASLFGLFESVTSTHNKLTVNRRQGTRRISIALGERLFTVERKLWGALIRRLRVVAGEET